MIFQNSMENIYLFDFILSLNFVYRVVFFLPCAREDNLSLSAMLEGVMIVEWIVTVMILV